MIIDMQYGSTGKGLLAGYLAKREGYDTAVCAFATNAGHTYIDKSRGLHVMTQQLPTGITSPTVKNVLLGPGSLIHIDTLLDELARYKVWMQGKRLMIHPNAAIVASWHQQQEVAQGMSKIGSTTKGVGAAMIQRIRRDPDSMNIAGALHNWPEILEEFVVSKDEYRDALDASEAILIEGAQGFSLSMYHGEYPYVTSRDVTPWQIAADCGLPFKWASQIEIMGTMRTYPIRVNNRDGFSGPAYEDQIEMQWETIGQTPELTTVTKLPRRIFTFSDIQNRIAQWHCDQYWKTSIFLNFANYMPTFEGLKYLIKRIEAPDNNHNPARVVWLGYGPDDCDVWSVSGLKEDEGSTPD
jgi:adenylosuccinate synthase